MDHGAISPSLMVLFFLQVKCLRSPALEIFTNEFGIKFKMGLVSKIYFHL